MDSISQKQWYVNPNYRIYLAYKCSVGRINSIDTNRFNGLFPLSRGANCPPIRFFTAPHTHLPTKPLLPILSPSRVIENNAQGTSLILHVIPITKLEIRSTSEVERQQKSQWMDKKPRFSNQGNLFQSRRRLIRYRVSNVLQIYSLLGEMWRKSGLFWVRKEAEIIG